MRYSTASAWIEVRDNIELYQFFMVAVETR
jgi:hypothetical protein